MRRLALAFAAAGAALALISGLAAAAGPTVGGCPVFPADNYWNAPVDALPIHPRSDDWTASIGNAARLHPDWGNVLADHYGIPFTTVTGAQPLVPIVPDPAEDYSDESDPGPYPIPPDAPIEGGPASAGDRHVIVVETTNCRLYELYRATPIAAGASWRASSYARFDLNSNALRPAGWTSADAAGLPIFPGLVRWEEVAAGEIAHAVRFTAARIWGSENGQPKYLWPARHSSGSSPNSARPPMGARFRLKASFDVTPYSAPTQVILRALKRYGLVLADAGGNWYFQGVSSTSWPEAMFGELGSIAGNNFEAVDTSGLQAEPDSAAVLAGATATNYTSLWWNPAESGWGVNINHQGNILFATLFTYDAAGAPLWLVMSAGMRQADGVTFTGNLYRATGPAFDAVPFTPITAANLATVGTMSVSFAGTNAATLTYGVNNAAVTKSIQRQVYGSRAAACTPTTGGRFSATNYQDLWWNAAESGWGVNVTHQDDTLFATLFTYDRNGRGLWLVLSAGLRQPDGSYLGDLYRATGPPFDAIPFPPITAANLTKVGTMRFRFNNGESATLTYTVDGTQVTKTITRQSFSNPVPSCS